MVFTSPLVVTVGLTLTIPLSLVGEMVLQGSSKGLLYWFGAAVVVASFVFVDREEIKEEEETTDGGCWDWWAQFRERWICFASCGVYGT